MVIEQGRRRWKLSILKRTAGGRGHAAVGHRRSLAPFRPGHPATQVELAIGPNAAVSWANDCTMLFDDILLEALEFIEGHATRLAPRTTSLPFAIMRNELIGRRAGAPDC